MDTSSRGGITVHVLEALGDAKNDGHVQGELVHSLSSDYLLEEPTILAEENI